MCPCRAFHECLVLFCFVLFCFFRRKCGVSYDPNIPPQNKTQICDEKTKKQKKNNSSKALQGHTKHVRKKFRANSQKRRGHWQLKEFWVLCLNQPVALDIYSFISCIAAVVEKKIVIFVPWSALWRDVQHATTSAVVTARRENRRLRKLIIWTSRDIFSDLLNFLGHTRYQSGGP